MQILVFIIVLTATQTINLPQGAKPLKVIVIDATHAQLIVLADQNSPVVARRIFMTQRPDFVSKGFKANLVYIDSYVNSAGIGEGFFIEPEQPYVK